MYCFLLPTHQSFAVYLRSDVSHWVWNHYMDAVKGFSPETSRSRVVCHYHSTWGATLTLLCFKHVHYRIEILNFRKYSKNSVKYRNRKFWEWSLLSNQIIFDQKIRYSESEYLIFIENGLNFRPFLIKNLNFSIKNWHHYR